MTKDILVLESLVHATNEDRLTWHLVRDKYYRIDFPSGACILDDHDVFRITSNNIELSCIKKEDQGGAYIPLLREAIDARVSRYIEGVLVELRKMTDERVPEDPRPV